MSRTHPKVDECALCSGVARPSNEWDRPLFESANFVVLPSLGSLVEGWLLIVPRRHFCSVGALPRSLAVEMVALKKRVWTRLAARYGNVCAFEHGPSGPRRAVGCGVDHAHVHLVPVGFDLIRAASPYLPSETAWSNAGWEACRGAFEQTLDYLYVEQSLGVGRIATGKDFGSQVLRKAIATSVDKTAQFDWRAYPQHETITQTIRAIARPVFAEVAR